MAEIDFTSDAGKRARERLDREQVIWLTTVNADGIPQSSPVWFLWRDEGFDIYSQPNTPKLRSIARHPEVSLNLNASATGEDVVIFEGMARVTAEGSPGPDDPDYVEKYSRLIEGWTPDDFAASFDIRIRVQPTRLRTY